MSNKLAIVIPAYKSRFIDQALESFAMQTCKDFTLYIGDDASPENLVEIVKKYESRIPIVYHRFGSNLGGTDLVAQWERCIDLVRNEEWIWLFSDDDIVSSDCVQGFYTLIKNKTIYELNNRVLRFNLDIVDMNLNVLQGFTTPEEFSVEYFLESCFIKHKLKNKAVEFIFSKHNYQSVGKFVNFPLAWGSDIATILRLGRSAGFLTIPKGKVSWRDSGFNISSLIQPEVTREKQRASQQFYFWLFGFIKAYKDSELYESMVFRILLNQSPLISIFEIKKLGIESWILNFKVLFWIILIKTKRFFKYSKFKTFLKSVINK